MFTKQGSSVPLQSVLQAATAVKILTEKFYNGIAYILLLHVGLSLKFHLTLHQLAIDCVYQNDNSGLSVDYGDSS